jgi:hypothetical protein
MTKALPFTEETIRRAIAAARKEGLDINAVSIRPDGTVTVHKDTEIPLSPINDRTNAKWLDVEA